MRHEGHPTKMIDRWQDWDEPAHGEGLTYWHMLVGTDPDVIALVREARRKLAPFSGPHLTPHAWLHMTALIAGSAGEIAEEQIRQMTSAASRLLANISPPIVTVGKILYHPEAIMLAARPTETLMPILEAVQEATQG